mgnify:CR=1 FL=1
MTNIAGKTVLLTGASGGIGRVIVDALVKEQATIIGVSRSKDKLDRLASAVNAQGGTLIAIPFDISQTEQLPKLIEQIQVQVPSVDILINNAGIEIYRAFQDYSSSQIQAILSTNLLAAIELSRLLLPDMLHRKQGHIVNLSSLAAKKGHPYDSIYSASKAGLLMWSDAIRQELAGTQVQISSICPGYVSDQGMLADTGVPAPSLSGTSTPEQVAVRVIKAIQKNETEVIVNQNWLSESLLKLLLTLWQIFPRAGDLMYRWANVVHLNQMRINPQAEKDQITLNSPLR